MSQSQWQLNGIKYRMKIDRFRDQLGAICTGKVFFSKKFKISKSQFRIKVSTENKEFGFVGVYLHSMNNWRVQCNFTIRARDREFNSGVTYMRPQGEAGQNLGIRNCWSKKDCKKIWQDNGRLLLEVDVQLLEEGRMHLELEKRVPSANVQQRAVEDFLLVISSPHICRSITHNIVRYLSICGGYKWKNDLMNYMPY